MRIAVLAAVIVIGSLIFKFKTISRENTRDTSLTRKVEVSVSSTFYPIRDYEARRTYRPFGRKVVPEDVQKLPCGHPFSGFHTADDLKVTEQEINVDVPVFAIKDGKVVKKAWVNGYGGLLVIEHEFDGEKLTTNYGHISLDNTPVNEGDEVKAAAKRQEL